MVEQLYVTNDERSYLRELARKQAEYAALPVMEQRKALWYAHNALRGDRPPVVMELNTFEGDMLPEARCTSPNARWMERAFQRPIINHEMINDDKVVPDYFSIPWQIFIKPYGMDVLVDHADDGHGGAVGFRWNHPIKTLKEDFAKLKDDKFWVDRELTQGLVDLAEDVFGDILPVKVENHSLHWHAALSGKIVTLMGMEQMLYALMDEPEGMRALYDYLLDNLLRFITWQEEEGLLTANNGNHYTGAGSYGFSNELADPRAESGENVKTRNLWLNLNSQETIGISPRMYKDFVYPFYNELSSRYGLVYYGCCEPVHQIWESSVSRYPNLRKVSISPWCDENYMGEALRDSKVIYSRKPSPNFVGVGSVFDEDGFDKHIRKTLTAAKGCNLEFIFRDVYTVTGDRSKPKRAVQIARQAIEDLW